jgi:hypothetical protein
MYDCACNNHGLVSVRACLLVIVVTRAQCWVMVDHYMCNCTSPYTGEECRSCVDGYHGAGTQVC